MGLLPARYMETLVHGSGRTRQCVRRPNVGPAVVTKEY